MVNIMYFSDKFYYFVGEMLVIFYLICNNVEDERETINNNTIVHKG